jgi:hypothetical protein
MAALLLGNRPIFRLVPDGGKQKDAIAVKRR